VEANQSLLNQQQLLRTKYDDAIKVKADVQQRQDDLMVEILHLHNAVLNLCPNKQLPIVENIGKLPPTPAAAVKMMIPSQPPTLSSTPPPQMITSRTMSVPTAAALKMGVGFPLNNLRKDDTGRILSTQRISNDALMNECGTCKKCTDQHLLAKCDTCHRFYHLGCLNPPLTRHPKRSKLYAWQCSECDKSDDSGHENNIIPKGPRRSRIRYSKDGPIIPDPLRDSFGSEKSMSLSRKSDESHHQKAVNGSSVEAKIPDLHEAAKIAALPVNETLFCEIVPTTTSTPIVSKDELPQLTVKKRGRKPRPKTSFQASKSTIDLTTSLDQPLVDPAPPKEKVKKERKEKKLLTVAKTTPLSDLSMSLDPPPKVVKKGRPKKEKPSIPQASIESVQEKQEIPSLPEEVEVKPEVTVINVTRKVELPLEQFRTSVPHLASIADQQPKEAEVSTHPLLAIASVESLAPVNHISDLQNGSVLNGDGATSSCSGHKNKKKKKRRHSNSPSSGDRASSTKKKKRKHKQKDLEFNDAQAIEMFKTERSPEQPPIKMKFSSINSSGKGQKWKLASADGSPCDDLKPATFNDVYKLHQVSWTVFDGTKCALFQFLTEVFHFD
jgi:PHD-finger